MCSILLYVMSTKRNTPKKPGGARKRPSAAKPARMVGPRPGPPAHLATGAGAGRTSPGSTHGTGREQAILDFIAGSLRERGYPPTLREIGTEFGIASTNGVRYYLDRLEHSGRIRRDRWTSRGIELQAIEGGIAGEPDVAEGTVPARAPMSTGRPVTLRHAPEPIEIPILGRVAAGAPILAEENIEDVLIVDGALVRPGKHFALRVRGDSMKNAGILDGDLVIVRHEAPVKSGEIGVVLIGDEATVKRVFPRRDKVLLLPENDDYKPIEVRPTDPEVRVAGKVVGVFRRLD
jgi:repressor LexA